MIVGDFDRVLEQSAKAEPIVLNDTFHHIINAYSLRKRKNGKFSTRKRGKKKGKRKKIIKTLLPPIPIFPTPCPCKMLLPFPEDWFSQGTSCVYPQLKVSNLKLKFFQMDLQFELKKF